MLPARTLALQVDEDMTELPLPAFPCVQQGTVILFGEIIPVCARRATPVSLRNVRYRLGLAMPGREVSGIRLLQNGNCRERFMRSTMPFAAAALLAICSAGASDAQIT